MSIRRAHRLARAVELADHEVALLKERAAHSEGSQAAAAAEAAATAADEARAAVVAADTKRAEAADAVQVCQYSIVLSTAGASLPFVKLYTFKSG